MFVPLCVSVSSIPFCFFAFRYLSAFIFCFASSSFLFFCVRYLIPGSSFSLFFASLRRGYACFFFFLSLFYTPREACEPAVCQSLRILLCVSFLDLLPSIASLRGLNFFLSLPFWMCDFFDFDFDFSTSSCYLHPVYLVCGLLGFCGDLYSVPRISDTYVRGPPFLCFVVLSDVQMCLSYEVYYSLLVLFFTVSQTVCRLSCLTCAFCLLRALV